MTNFGYWQDLAMANGKCICMVCMEPVPLDEVWVDSEGVRWDVCKPCGDREEEIRRSQG